MGSSFAKVSLVIGLCVSWFFGPHLRIQLHRKESDRSAPKGNGTRLPTFGAVMSAKRCRVGYGNAGARGLRLGVLFACFFLCFISHQLLRIWDVPGTVLSVLRESSFNPHSNTKVKLRPREKKNPAWSQLGRGRTGSGTQAFSSPCLCSLTEGSHPDRCLFTERNLPLMCPG